MNIRFALIVSLLFCSTALLAATQVYKKVLPDGTTVYTDEAIEDAEVMMVEPVPTVPAFKAPPSSFAPQTESSEPAAPAGYSSLEIISPSHDSAFHSGAGTVEIKFTIQPALIQGDKFKIFLGSQLLAEQTDTTLILNNVDRGTHTLSVHLVDRSGKILKTANSTFTLHRPSVLN